MKFTFVPEYILQRFDKADAEFLSGMGIKGIILDIDNTLEPYENDVPGNDVLKWFDSLKANGISVAFVSNNNKERVELFNRNLNFPAYCKAKKPFKKNVLKAMMEMGTSPHETIFMGDQIFTDVWSAHRAGIRAILVPPIKDKTDILTKFKRKLEKPIIKKYYRRKGILDK